MPAKGLHHAAEEAIPILFEQSSDSALNVVEQRQYSNDLLSEERPIFKNGPGKNTPALLRNS